MHGTLRRPHRHGAGRTSPAAASVGAVPVLHGPEPLELADRPGAGPRRIRCAGHDGATAPRLGCQDRARAAGGRGGDRRGLRRGRAQGPTRGGGQGGHDIYTEQASSVRERPELDLLRRRILRPGDDLVVTRLDRLARSARDTLALAEEFGQRGVTLRILDPAITIEPPGSGRSRASPETNGSMAGAMSRMILTVMAAMAQLEREIMLERQREGIARAKAEGKYKGQPPHARAKAPQVIELAAAGRTRAEIATALEISERSVYRILAETRAGSAGRSEMSS